MADSKKTSATKGSDNNQTKLVIDYDKLAEAIVKANQKANQASHQNEKKEHKPKEKGIKKYLEAVKWTFKGGDANDGGLLSNSIALFTSLMLKVIALSIIIAGGFYSIKFKLLAAFPVWQELSFENKCEAVIMPLEILLLAFLFFMILWGSSKAVWKEKD